MNIWLTLSLLLNGIFLYSLVCLVTDCIDLDLQNTKLKHIINEKENQNETK